jgi:HAD superfamily hydrolase (TIGR01509 family)
MTSTRVPEPVEPTQSTDPRQPTTLATQLPAAVLWDLDGTLVDTEPYWMAEERRLVEQHGGTWTDEQAKSLVGNDLLTSARYIKDSAGLPLAPEEIVEVMLVGMVRRMRAHVPWRPGARELLRALGAAGVPCALVTMSYTTLAEAFVQTLPPGTFGAVVTGDTVGRGKPHPEPYLRAAELLGVDPTRCVAIEDSPTGVTSAEAAGVSILAVPHVVAVPPALGRSRVLSLAEVSLPDLSRIAAGSAIDGIP